MILAAIVLQIATATPAPPPVLSGGFGRPAVKATATVPARRGTFSVAGPSAPSAAAPAVATPAPSPEADWRSRVARLRADLAAAEADLATQGASLTVISHGRPGRDHFMLLAIRDAALAAPRAKVNELRRELARLPEECRTTAGCQPGWVR